MHKKFSELGLSADILKSIETLGYEEASPIQSQAIPAIMAGNDIIGQSQTGTGKTAAFSIPVIEKIDKSNKHVQALILSPTRELAVQIAEECTKLLKHTSGISVLPIYGGQDIVRQMRGLQKGVQIVIGTPGRIMDHMDRKTLDLSHVRFVVLDEADRMLDMGFQEDIELILKSVPTERQTIFFSATIPREMERLMKKYSHDPVEVKIEHKTLTVAKITQKYFEVGNNQKTELLSRLIDVTNIRLGIVFCNTKRMVDELTENLRVRGYPVESLHGDMKQMMRDRVMKKMKNGQVQLLIATDVAARGIDVDDVEVVVNYDLPQDEEDYVHRIGRTGRAGKTGIAYNFVSGRDIYKLRDIQRFAKITIERAKVPTQIEVAEARSVELLKKVQAMLTTDENLDKYIKIVENLLDDNTTPITVAAALLKNILEKDGKASSNSNKEIVTRGTMTRLFINVGKLDRVRPGDIVGAIAGETGISGDLIGKIDMMPKFSFVEIPSEFVDQVLQKISGVQIRGRRINMEVAEERKN